MSFVFASQQGGKTRLPIGNKGFTSHPSRVGICIRGGHRLRGKRAVTISGTGTWGLGGGTRVWDVGRVG